MLVLAGVLGAGGAFAQSPLTPEPTPDREVAVPEAPAALDTQPASPPDEATARAAQLDALFSELAKPENPNWERVQAQIWAAWSQSGSVSMDFLLYRATQAMEAEQLDIALLHLNNLVRLAPNFPEAWNKRATVYFLQRDYGASMADIERVLSLEPRHFGALSGMGIILDRLGDEPGAYRAYRRVLELHPNFPAAQQAVDRLAPEL
ncbi:MAG: hypothetical protein AAF568_09615 [Pseudomonadota bacterium]